MKKMISILSAVILLLSTISKSRADCTFHTAGSCYTWADSGNCGTGCTYTYDNGTLTIKASGDNATINRGKFSGRYYDGDVFPVDVDNIIIDGYFASINQHAVQDLNAIVSGKDGKLILQTNGWNAFGENTLKGEILVSQDMNKIDEGTFFDVTIDGTLIIPDNIKSIEAMAFYGLRLAEGAKIYCAIDDCAEKILDSCKQTTYNKNLSIDRCKQNLEPLLSNPTLFEQAPEGCSYWSADGCKKCSNKNFKFDGDYCYRVRYTPAEAAEVAGETNTIFLYYK